MRNQNRSDLIEQHLLPKLLIWLPKPIAIWLLRTFFLRGLFSESVSAIDEAEKTNKTVRACLKFDTGQARDSFFKQQSLCRLLDMSDALKGAAAFRASEVEVHGQWPKTAFVAISFHFGTGLLGLAHLHHYGGLSAFISRPYATEEFIQRKYHARGVNARLQGIAAATGHPIIFTGGNYEKLADILKTGVSICGLMDTPVRPGQRFVLAPLFGRQIKMPTGLLRLAQEAGVPVVIFSVTPDLRSGKRVLRIEVPMPVENAESMSTIARSVTQHFEERIKSLPAAWYFWPQFSQLSGDNE